MYRRILSKLAYRLFDSDVLVFLKKIDKERAISCLEKEQLQISKFHKIVTYASENVEFYKKLYSHITPSLKNFVDINDIEELPIVTKEQIIDHYEEFFQHKPPNKFVNVSTGGTTGTPLKYCIDKTALSYSKAKIINGFGYGGYVLGDKLATIAGGSLVSGKYDWKKQAFHRYILGKRYFSSYDLSDNNINKYIGELNRWKPKFLRGYVSTMTIIADYLLRENISIKFDLKGIFTTSEKLNESQREIIMKAFKCPVFDNYGLHEGGISAFECSNHTGLHIDTINSFLEVVDNNGKRIYDTVGRIIATDFYNYAFPFIRYETGDYGIMTQQKCVCGRNSYRLISVIGRETDYLEINGTKIGSPVLTVVMGRCNIKQYQIHQINGNTVKFIISKKENYSKADEDFIKTSFLSYAKDANIVFEYVDIIKPYQGNKLKVVIRYDK